MEERFWSKVNKTETCWLWTAYCDKGYGIYRVNKKKIMKAHRYSYIINKGEISENLLVRHTCDVRNCVNPDHLELGTNQDNMNDMKERGRQAKGENGGNAKFTADDVREIRIVAVFGFTNRELAKMYNMGKSTVSSILRGELWKHI